MVIPILVLVFAAMCIATGIAGIARRQRVAHEATLRSSAISQEGASISTPRAIAVFGVVSVVVGTIILVVDLLVIVGVFPSRG